MGVNLVNCYTPVNQSLFNLHKLMLIDSLGSHNVNYKDQTTLLWCSAIAIYLLERIIMPPLSPLKKTGLTLAVTQAIAMSSAHADSIEVTTNSDAVNNTGCSLREAIVSFNSGVTAADCERRPDTFGIDFITFDDDVANQTIYLENGELTISTKDRLYIDGRNVITIDAQRLSRALTVSAGADFAGMGLTITGGNVSGSGGAGNGAGIRVLNGANLILRNSTVTNNSAEDDGGGIFLVDATAQLINTTVSSNSARLNGAAIDIAYGSTATIRNSTISGNRNNTTNRDIVNVRGGSTLEMASSTISDNITSQSGASLDVTGTGSSVRDSIIANTVDGADCNIGNSTIRVDSANIIEDGSCLVALGVGQSIDPLLGPLAYNGGPTRTHALLSGSPAIDPQRTSADATPNDQRGFAAIGPRDIGAFEYGSTPGLNLTVDSVSDDDTSGCTLRAAIDVVNANVTLNNGCTNDVNAVAGDPTIINFGASVAGNTIALSQQSQLEIRQDVSINPANLNTTIQAADNLNVVNIRNSTVSLNHVTITGGNSANDGGGFFADNSSVSLSNSTISGNSANEGGGFFTDYSSVSLNNSTISGNSANIGGGFTSVNGILNMSNSTVSGNSAISGGGFLSSNVTVGVNNSTVSGNSAIGSGGGFASVNGTVGLNNSTVSGNSAEGDGGGFRSSNVTVSLNNSTVSGNSAKVDGGGFYSRSGTVSLNNSTVSGNSAASRGGGIFTFLSSVNLSNSIVANSEEMNCFNNSGILNITDAISDDASCGDARQVPNALLGPLADNGGPTLTHALLAGSPAINTGLNENCPATDQRGESRDANCDIGAVEFIEEQACFVVKAANGNVITFCL